MPESIGSIGQIAFTVRDVDLALSFYRDVLGLPFLFRAGPDLAFLRAGEVRLMLSTPQGAGTIGGNSILYFRTDDVETAYRVAVERGASEERPPQVAATMSNHSLWLAFLRDPDGNIVGLMEERPVGGG